MENRIEIYICTHKDGTVSIDVKVPKQNVKCRKENYDPGYEADTNTRVYEEGEGILMDNLD